MQDAAGHVTSASAPNGGNQATLQYDAAGRLTQVTNRDGFVTAFTYDALDRLVLQAGSDGPGEAGVRFTYSANNQIAWRTEANGQTTIFQYGAIGRLVRIIQPNGGMSDFDYCAGGDQVCATWTRTATFRRTWRTNWGAFMARATR